MNGRLNWYDLATPELVRIPADGSGKIEGIVNGRLKNGNTQWFFWMRQPAVSPKASMSSRSCPTAGTRSRTTSSCSSSTPRRTNSRCSKLAETAGLGHQDPVWMRDGRYLLLVKNGRDGTRGAPQIIKYNPENERSFTITGPGYLAPSPSPDNKYIAATRTDGFGTNIVILDGTTGAELLRVTDDDGSFSPVWSPAGDSIAFLHLDGAIVDLEMVAARWRGRQLDPRRDGPR